MKKKTCRQYYDLPNGQMKDRVEHVMKRMNRLQSWGMRETLIHPDVLRKLLKTGRVYMNRVFFRGCSGKISGYNTYYSTDHIPIASEIRNPWRKRTEGLVKSKHWKHKKKSMRA